MTALFPFLKAVDDSPLGKGRWRCNSDGHIFYCCPGCGRIIKMINYNVDDDGKVLPSLECPTEACHFHRFVMLLGWEPI